MRVVLHTNIIVSGLNFSDNKRLVPDLVQRGRIELYQSDFILKEVAGVVTHKLGLCEGRNP